MRYLQKAEKSINFVHINCKQNRNKISTFFLFIFAYVLYFLSLEACYEGEEICGNNMKWIYKKIIQIILSCELITYLITKILFYNLSKLHLFHLFLIFLLFYIYSHSYFFFNHGMYNLIVFLLLLVLNLIIILIIKTIIYLFQIKNKIYISLKISLICFLILLYIYKIPNIDCDDWEKGLNNTSIINDNANYGCIIKIPKLCPYKVLYKYQDYSKILNINCSIKKTNYRKIILKSSKSPYITKNTTKIGFPLTNSGLIGCSDGLDDIILKEYVWDNLFDVSNNYNNFTEPELIVDFSKDPLGEILIDLKYNDSLSNERKKLEYKNIPYSNNILIIYIDSVSRPQSIRQLKKTLNFFEKFISYEGSYNENFPDEKFHSFQFFKYHSFIGRTAGNYPILYYGNKRESKNIIRINKYFKDNGYITNYCCDLCKKDNSRTLHNATFQELYDHQLLLCDPNVIRYHKPIKKCLYGKEDFSYLFNYSEQFWRKYQNNRKFSSIILNGAHEGTMEVLKYYDDIIFEHLTSLYNDNLFKDSSIFLLSDHGCGLQSIYYAFEFFKRESVLPMLFVLINDRKNISYNEQYFYINQNQQTFITGYDIYNTINHLLYGDNYKQILNLTDETPTPKSPFGGSLFEKMEQKFRKAKTFENMEQTTCI